jgi:hypothetical protein
MEVEIVGEEIKVAVVILVVVVVTTVVFVSDAIEPRRISHRQ